MRSRSPVMVSRGLVTSSHELASFQGARVMAEGGNVVDAAVATSAVLCVVQNNLCGLGGDLFALFRVDGSRVRGINGSGRAGRRADPEFYRSRGHAEIPRRGPLSAVTVPGIVHAWGELSSRYGTMELRDLLAPAIGYAESGFPVTPKYAESVEVSRQHLGGYEGWSRTFVPGGRPPLAGDLFVQKELAASLRLIAEEGPRGFYQGTLSEKIVAGVEEEGGVLGSRDLASHQSTWAEPLSTDYRGVKVYETAPNSQGATALLWLNLLEEHRPGGLGPGSKELLRLFADTYAPVNAERSARIADPSAHPLPPRFATKEYAAALGPRPHPGRTPAAGLPGDTTYFAVADSEGNCASVIQSNYMGFGSGLVPAGTGIVLQNRGCYFTLEEGHHNALGPGRRTFHTLCASLGERDGRTHFVLGCMGGDVQPQVHVQLMTRLMDHGMDIQESIDFPRWAIPGTIYERPTRILLEEGLPAPETGLRAEGIGVHSSATGHAQGILFTRGGMAGGADPRGDGMAAGF